ncbi:hypothetical protein HRG84_05225 [Flavisolibacter sp. BT320]|nr:hypothetical protein [Flavisolibacter longurius]
MGHIKEPKGVDFIIESKPLTDYDRAAISEYIRDYKAKEKVKKISNKSTKVTKRKKASA